MNPNIFVRREKLRRQFEMKFRDINNDIRENASSPFMVKYSDHLLDRAIQRDIDANYVFNLIEKITEHTTEVNDFLRMEPLPDVEEHIDPDKVYRPLRLELTDGNLWIGMTVDKCAPGKIPRLKCRMAFINNRRLEGKISTKVIKTR